MPDCGLVTKKVRVSPFESGQFWTLYGVGVA
jgi:hypothetical protein